MRANVGSADRVVRIVVGLALIVAAFVPGLSLFANAVVQWGAVLVGAVLIATALAGFCPLYRLLGISTCKIANR